MRITFVIDRFPSEPGGVKKVLTALADGLSVNHDVVIVVPETTPRGRFHQPSASSGERWSILRHDQGLAARLLSAPAGYVAIPGVRRFSHGHLGLPAARVFANVGGQSLARALPRPDVVHSFTSDMTGHLALGLGNATRAPVVFTGFPHPGQYGDGPIDYSAYRRAASVVALTEHDRSVYMTLGVDPRRIAVIPPPSDDLGTTGRERARRRLEIAGRLVVFAGVRRSYKGADILYAAAPLIGAAVTGVTIAFVGPGRPIGPVPGVEIRDTGEVGTETIWDWIRAADVVALPSLHEICPLVVLEAWSAGVPVVVSDIPALRHLIRESGAGIAVARHASTVSTAIVRLLRDDVERRTLGQLGRRYWDENCRLAGILAAHIKLYAGLVGSPGTSI